MQAAFNQALEKQVRIVPAQAAEGIKSIVTNREDELGQLWRSTVP